MPQDAETVAALPPHNRLAFARAMLKRAYRNDVRLTAKFVAGAVRVGTCVDPQQARDLTYQLGVPLYFASHELYPLIICFSDNRAIYFRNHVGQPAASAIPQYVAQEAFIADVFNYVSAAHGIDLNSESSIRSHAMPDGAERGALRRSLMQTPAYRA